MKHFEKIFCCFWVYNDGTLLWVGAVRKVKKRGCLLIKTLCHSVCWSRLQQCLWKAKRGPSDKISLKFTRFKILKSVRRGLKSREFLLMIIHYVLSSSNINTQACFSYKIDGPSKLSLWLYDSHAQLIYNFCANCHVGEKYWKTLKLTVCWRVYVATSAPNCQFHTTASSHWSLGNKILKFQNMSLDIPYFIGFGWNSVVFILALTQSIKIMVSTFILENR